MSKRKSSLTDKLISDVWGIREVLRVQTTYPILSTDICYQRLGRDVAKQGISERIDWLQEGRTEIR